MVSIGKEEWRELIRLLKNAEKSMVALGDDAEDADALNQCREALKTFSTTVAMLGMEDLSQAGARLESFFDEHVLGGNGSIRGEEGAVFNFALNALMESMMRTEKGQGESGGVNVEEVLSILETANDASEAPGGQGQGPSAEEALDEDALIDELVGSPAPDTPAQDPGGAEVERTRLRNLANRLGAKVEVRVAETGEEIICLEVPAESQGWKDLLVAQSSLDNWDTLRPRLAEEREPAGKVLEDIKEFMLCMSEGNVERAQEILLRLSESSHPGLYKEIGTLARELHDSLRDFVGAMDPALREMVEDKIPDSGNRLEHIIKLTETAANTTLDHVEALQKRNEEDQSRLKEMETALDGLHAIGDNARERLTEVRSALEHLAESARRSHEDLIQILTAQDYQDLTGQIIMKIITLLEDLEVKLVQLITKFGVKVEKAKKAREELYGPAHEQVEEALHSQSDVDALLAEFGF